MKSFALASNRLIAGLSRLATLAGLSILSKLRYARSTYDLFSAWLLWGPTRISRSFSIATGVRAKLLPQRAGRAFDRAMRLKLYRTAVEILVLTNIVVTDEVLGNLLHQCLLRGYMARAMLLAPFLDHQKRAELRDHLLMCDQLELAMAVATIDGVSVDEIYAAKAALRRQLPDRRAKRYASRIVPKEKASEKRRVSGVVS